MGVRENKIEKYLDQQVKALGGDTRKWVSPGRDGVPDRIVFLYGKIFFCEIKTVDGKLSLPQQREHARLKDLDASVCTIYGQKGVDLFLKNADRLLSDTYHG